ncbi:MAG: hypothetical protein ACRD36_06870, partial [Candidatus Acidiferrum sp.]
MPRRWIMIATLFAVAGCADAIERVGTNIILPEQRTINYRDPAQLPASRIPPTIPPRTVSDPRPQTEEWQVSLDEAIKIALENAAVVRVLTGLTATSSGQTIYDAAISNTSIDQEQARFDPNLAQKNTGDRTNIPLATFDPFDPTRSMFTSTPTDEYRSELGLTKTNVLGGQWSLNWIEDPMRFHGGNNVTTTGGAISGFGSGFPLNPQNNSSVTLNYTQPFLQGGGYQVNLAPIVIARINTERSFFQYKD